MMHKAWSSIEEVPYCFSRSSVKLHIHTTKEIVDFDPYIERFRTVTPVRIDRCYEMMHKAWSSIEEVPYRFSRSSVKVRGHAAKKKSSIRTQIGRFQSVTLDWIHQWLWNDTQSLKQHRRGALLLAATKQLYEWFSLSVTVLPLSPPGWRGIVVTVRAGGRAAAKIAESISR